MKPAPFEYVAARSVEEALAALEHEDARVLAGGQSLLPLLNARLARPARLVDINGAGLGVIRRSGGTLQLGATVRQAALLALAARRRALAAARPGRPPRRPRRDALARHGRRLGRPRRPARRSSLPRWRRSTPRYVASGRGERRGCCVSIELPPLPAGRADRVRRARPHARRLRRRRRGGRARPGPRRASPCSGPAGASSAEQALLEGATAREAAALAAEEVEGAHRKALVAEVTRRALVECGAMTACRDQRRRARGRGRAAHAAVGLHPRPGPDRHEGRLRARRLRRLHGAARRRAGALLPDARRPGRRLRRPHDRGPRARPAAGVLPRAPRAPVRVLHRGHPDDARRLPARAPRARPSTSCARRWPATSAAARATARSSSAVLQR